MIFWQRMLQKINSKWYPRAVTVGKPVEIRELSQRLSRESTVAPADVYAVIHSFPEVMADFMAEGRSVRLDGFGSFRYTLDTTGNGVDSKDKVSSDQIKGVRVQFTAERQRSGGGKTYTRALVSNNITFAEWLGKDSAPAETPGGGEGGGDDVLE